MLTAISCNNEKKQSKTILDNNVVTPPLPQINVGVKFEITTLNWGQGVNCYTTIFVQDYRLWILSLASFEHVCRITWLNGLQFIFRYRLAF